MTTLCETTAEAVAGIEDGSTVLISGFGMAGMPVSLVDALIDRGTTDLTAVSNNPGNGLAALLDKDRVLRAAGAGIGTYSGPSVVRAAPGRGHGEQTHAGAVPCL